MTSTDDPVNLRALRDTTNHGVCEPGDRINTISVMLAVVGGLLLLALTIGGIWKLA